MVFTALPALAAEGRTPVWLPNTTIATDGRYIVTRNITGAGGPGALITIAASNVDLDLNGFTLDNSGAATPVIEIAVIPTEVAIRDGILLGGVNSIVNTSATGQRVIVENVRIRDPFSHAIHLTNIENPVIRRNHISMQCGDTGGHGIFLDGVAVFKNGTVEHNSLRGPIDAISVIRGSALAVRHNRIEVPCGNGILLDDSLGCLIEKNTVSDADVSGIFLRNSRGNKIYNNTFHRGEVNGVHIGPNSRDNFILDNVIRECGFLGSPVPVPGGGHGMRIDGFRNHIERNTMNENNGCGLFFSPSSSGNIFGDNMARGNDPGFLNCLPAPPCVGLLFPPNSCDGSGAGNDTRGGNMIPGPPSF
jgi:parallel beta-helix repeat protein